MSGRSNPASADDLITLIEHGRLTRRHSEGIFIQPDESVIAFID